MALWHFIGPDGHGHAWLEGKETVSTWDDGLAFMPGEDGFTRELAAKKATQLGKGIEAHLSGVPNWHSRIEAEQQAAYEKELAEKEAEREQEGARINKLRAEREKAEADEVAELAAKYEAQKAAEEAERIAAETAAREEAARTEIRRLTDPEGYAKEQARIAARARYDELSKYATNKEKTALKAALGLDILAL
jgi:dTMP kinase